MTTLVAGATGATGKELVNQLLIMGHKVKVIVRPNATIPETWENDENVFIIKAGISGIDSGKMADYLKDCQSVASCLGHRLTFKGLFGKPKRLVADAVQLLCEAIKTNSPEKTMKFVLMNTTGNWNRDLDESISVGEKIVIGLVRLLLPPQSDNEKAADYLRVNIGQNNKFVEWVAVRPDTLINKENVSEYEIHMSPTRSAVFNTGKTSRINVGNFMARLIADNDLWNKWKGQMPVIYNIEH